MLDRGEGTCVQVHPTRDADHPWEAGTPHRREQVRRIGPSLGQAERIGAMRVSGAPWAHRMLARWGTLSPFADDTPVATPLLTG